MSGYIPIGLASVLISILGQLMLRQGMRAIGPVDMVQVVRLAPRLIGSIWIVGGFFLYLIGAVLWLVVLSRVTINRAFPMTAIKYVITPVLAVIWLGEEVTAYTALGTVLIVAGIWLTFQ